MATLEQIFGQAYQTNTLEERLNRTIAYAQEDELLFNDRFYVFHTDFRTYYLMDDQSLIERINIHGLYQPNMTRLDAIRTLINRAIRPDQNQAEATLLPSQINHFNRSMEILHKIWYAYQDTSPMGAGKTYIVSNIARTMKQTIPELQIIVVCPVVVIDKWEHVPTLFGFKSEEIHVLGYERLAGVKFRDLSHPFLTRSDETGEGRDPDFTVTPFFDQMARNGVLLIFDENQRVKNPDAARTKAAATLTRHVVSLNRAKLSQSRIALLSATPGETDKVAFAIMQMLGIVTAKDIVNRGKITGLNSVIQFSRKKNPAETELVLAQFPPSGNREEAYRLARELYVRAIKPSLSTSAPMPQLNHKNDYKNGFYQISGEQNRFKIMSGLDLLSKLAYSKSLTDEDLKAARLMGITDPNNTFEIMTRAMMYIEAAKIFDMARVANQYLVDNPTVKIVLMVNYTASVVELVNLLQEYKPMSLTGQETRNRKKVLQKFQEPNLDRRVLIANTEVGSVGLDLNDKHGMFPRVMLIVPSFKFLSSVQATGRISRIDNMSDATVRFFYSALSTSYHRTNDLGQLEQVHTNEVTILDSYVRKSSVAKGYLADETTLVFPGDYPSVIEPVR